MEENKTTKTETQNTDNANPAPPDKEMKYFVDTHAVREQIMERFGLQPDLKNPPSTEFVDDTVAEFANKHGGKIAESQLTELWDWILSLWAKQVEQRESQRLRSLAEPVSGLQIPEILQKSPMLTQPAVAMFSQKSSFEPESRGSTLLSDLQKLAALDGMGKLVNHGVPASQSVRLGRDLGNWLLGHNPNDNMARSYNATTRFHDRNIETAKANNEYLDNMIVTVDEKVGGNFIHRSWALQHLQPRLTKSDRVMVKSVKEANQTITGMGTDGSFEKVAINKKSFHVFHLGNIGAYVQSCLRALRPDLVSPWYQDVQNQFEVYTRQWFETALFNGNFGVVAELTAEEKMQMLNQGDLESAVSTENFKGLLGMFRKADGQFKASIATEIDGTGYAYKHWDKFLWALKLEDGALFGTHSGSDRLFFAHHGVYTFLRDICNAQQISSEPQTGVTTHNNDSVLQMPNGDKVICQNPNAAFIPATYMVSVPPKALFFGLNMENPYFDVEKPAGNENFKISLFFKGGFGLLEPDSVKLYKFKNYQ